MPGVRSSAGPGGLVDVMAQKRAAHATCIAAHHSAAAHRSAIGSTAVLASALDAAPAPIAGPAADADPAAGTTSPRQHGPIVPDVVGSGGTGRFRDAEFFVSAERPDRHAEEGYAVGDRGRGALHANVLDLTGEGGAAAGGRKTVWDNKKKRYVTLQRDETMKAGKRVKVKGGVAKVGGKSGDDGDGDAGAIYKKWLKRGGKKVALGSGGSMKGGASAMGDRCVPAACCTALWWCCLCGCESSGGFDARCVQRLDSRSSCFVSCVGFMLGVCGLCRLGQSAVTFDAPPTLGQHIELCQHLLAGMCCTRSVLLPWLPPLMVASWCSVSAGELIQEDQRTQGRLWNARSRSCGCTCMSPLHVADAGVGKWPTAWTCQAPSRASETLQVQYSVLGTCLRCQLHSCLCSAMDSLMSGLLVAGKWMLGTRARDDLATLFRRLQVQIAGCRWQWEAADGGSVRCRFKHGGRGWTNEFKAKRANGGAKDDLKSEVQMRKDAQKKDRMKQHLQAKSKNKVSKKKGKGKGR